MMKVTRRVGLAAVALGLMSAGQECSGASLSLDYSVTASGGLYRYDFTLGINTSGGALTPGEGWGWVIFGDEQQKPSPLADFTLVGSIVGGPWSFIASSGGFHNGPTLGPVFDSTTSAFVYWQPTQATDTITWSGTSSSYLGQGALLFSNLETENGATNQFFDVAHLVSSNVVPEPSTLASSGIAGVIGLGGTLIRRRKWFAA